MKILDRLSPTEKKWAFATLTLSVVALSYAGIVEPMLGRVPQDQARVEAKKAAMKKSLKSVSQYEALRAEIERMSVRAPSLSGQENITESLRNLEAMAEQCSVSIATIKPQIFDEEDGPKRILFDISAQAQAANLARFLFQLESSGRLLRVKRLTVSTGSQDSGALQCVLLVSELASG